MVAGPHRRRMVARTLAGACHPGPCLAVSAITVALARATGRPRSEAAGAGVAVLAGQLAVGWHNDWLDADRDRIAGRDDKPLVAHPEHRPLVARAATSALACCVPLSLLSGPRAAAAHLTAVGSALGYNAALKNTAWSWVPYGASFSLLVAFVGLGRPGHRPPAWWAPLAAGLLGVGAHFANVLPDLEDDERTGVRGLPHRLGRRRSTIASAGLVAAASVVVTLAPGRADWPVIGLPVGAATLAVGAAAERRRPGAMFASVLAVAVLDALLLTGRGTDL